MTAKSHTIVSIMNYASDPLSNAISSDGVYLLVGGFGGLGLSIAQFLAENGAKKLGFLSRSGPRTSEATRIVSMLEDEGVLVGDYRADVCNREQVLQAFDSVRSELGGDIQGVIQCAAVVKVS
jgi:zearalenone synthase (highly reducing iterative type I polyketide synthase)